MKTTHKYLKINTPYGQYKILFDDIIKEYAEYYIKKHNIKNTSDYKKEIQNIEYNVQILYSWMIQKTKWEDWKKHYKKISDVKFDYKNFWTNIYIFELIEE